jgi:HEAT repeat protein
MRISSLVEQLTAPGPGHRQVAANELVAAGAPAVGPLVAALRDCDGWHAHHYVEVLQQIGDPALRPLVDALANSTSPRAHNGAPSRTNPIGKALVGLRISDRNMVVPLLHHERPNVRSWACSAVAAMGTEALPYLPAVLALLADEDPDVRYSACGVFLQLTDESLAHLPALLPLLADPVDFVRREAGRLIRGIGSRAVPVLREMRRSPGPRRRHALAGLAEIVGWDGLDPADRALVQRLIRIRITDEVPEPFEPDGQWFAIPTSDQTAVLDALDLSDPMPVTMRLGEAAANSYILDGTVGYVSPVLDGWTLAFVWSLDLEDTTAALSRRFGTAHGYVNWDDYHGSGFAAGWCVAENGTVIRYYVYQDEFHQTGAPLPAEHGYVLPHEDPDAPDDVERCYATDIAARISVDPTAIGPHTRVEGHAVLALTADGRREGIPGGRAVPI